jgi:hypothetical protein
VERACQLGGEALQILSEVEYATGAQRVRDLRASLRPHRQHPAVADLTAQILLVWRIRLVLTLTGGHWAAR